jgi:hypothetical protein
MANDISVYQVPAENWLGWRSGVNNANQITIDRFSKVEGYETELIATIRAFIEEELPGKFIFPDISSGISIENPSPGNYDPESALISREPTLDRPTINDPDVPGNPTLENVDTDINLQTSIPTVPVKNYTLLMPEAPNDQMPDMIDPPVIDTNISLGAFNYIEPTKPTDLDVTIPAAPEISGTYTFEGQKPSIKLNPPTTIFSYGENPYTSDLLELLKEKLFSNLQSGGTGLGADVEDAIWNRMKDRRRIAFEEEIEKLESINSGFMRPTGPMMASRAKLTTAYIRELANDSREIAIEQARLAQANTQFIMQNAAAIEQILIGYANSMAERGYNAAVYTCEYAIKLFSSYVAGYNAERDMYLAEAQVVKDLYESDLVKIERYKGQLQGASIEAGIKRNKLDLYLGEWQGIDIAARAYSEYVRSKGLWLQSQSLKVDIYKAQVESLVKKVDFIIAKNNLYQSKLTAETLKIDSYGKELENFLNVVKAVGLEYQIEDSKRRLKFAKNEEALKYNNTLLSNSQGKLQYYLSQAGITMNINDLRERIFKTYSNVISDKKKQEIEKYRAEVAEVEAVSNLKIKDLEVQLQAAVAVFEKALSVANLKGQYLGNLLGNLVSSATVSAGADSRYSNNWNDTYTRSLQVDNSAMLTDEYRESLSLAEQGVI